MADTECKACGMHVGEGPRFHPYAACLMMMAVKNGNTVEANLRHVVQYGMDAGKAGVSLDRAMDTIVRPPNGKLHGDD